MKKNLTSQFWNCLSATVFFASVSFQASSQALPASFTYPSKAETAAPAPTSKSVTVNPKMQQSFYRHFENAQNVYWETVNNENFAHFTIEDRNGLAAIGKKGQINSTVLYGTEQHLPAEEKKLVQSIYHNYAITATQQVTKNHNNLWIVTLQNSTQIIKVKLMNDELFEMERMTRR